MGRCQHSIDVRKLGIGTGGFGRELNGLLIALREQGRPALAQVPNDQQLIARAKPDRLICICECGFAVAGERITHAEIAARIPNSD